MESVVITGGSLIVEEMNGDSLDFLFPVLKLKDVDYKELIAKRGLRYLTDATKMALVTAKFAKENAKLDEIVSERSGIVVATNFASFETVVNFDKTTITEGPRAVSAMQSPNLVLNATAAKLGMHFDMTGFNTTISSGRVSALDAIDYACNMIQNKEVDMVIVTGVEEMNEDLKKWFLETKTLDASELKQLKPFSGTLVLENETIAKKRNAKIYGKILDSCVTVNSNYMIDGGSYDDDVNEYDYMLSQLVENKEEIKSICLSDNRINKKNIFENKYINDKFPNVKKISIYDVFDGEFVGATGLAQVLYSLDKFDKGKGIIFCNDWTGNFRALLLQK